MVNLKNMFKDIGFILVDNKYQTYELSYNGNYILSIEPEYGGWLEDESFRFTVACKKFGAFTDKLFKNTNAKDYCDTVHKQGNALGIIGSGIGFIEIEDTPLLCSASGDIAITDFVAQLAAIENAAGIYELLYFGKTRKIMALFEGCWVQLFLLLEMGKSVEDIIEVFKNNPSDVHKPDNKDFDKQALLEFEKQYKSLAGNI